jgi:OmpA-OmpF porin, OOP family
MKKILTVFTLCFSTLFFGQEYLAELPENPGPNKCYAKCIVPDEYKDESVRVMIKPAYDRLEVVPAEYKNEYQEIVIRPASKRFIYEPAQYTTITDTLWVKDPYHQLKVIPASFETAYEQIEIKPKTGSWVAGEKDPDCPSINPADCRVFHYRESPAIQREIPVEKMSTSANTTAKRIEGNYKLITRQVETRPAQTREEAIPAKTQTIQRRVLVKDESTRKVTIPAVYKDVTKKVLVKKGGMNAWREVPCTIPERGKILPINYALGSSALTSRSKRIIDQYVLSVLKKDQSAIVEIGSHTDAQGSDQFNMTLSENRAKNVVEYLISKGVDESRLIAVGYGESKLLNDCANGVKCSEGEHLENRRTEFKVF